MSITIMTQKETTITIFDPSLTPQNAQKKGYQYIDDVIYDQLNPSETMIDILEFIREFHCKLGTPEQINAKDPFFGLYVPNKE